MHETEATMKKPIHAAIAAAGLLLASLSGLATASAQELKLAHFMSPKHPYHAGVFEWLGSELSNPTGGTPTVLRPPTATADFANTGVA